MNILVQTDWYAIAPGDYPYYITCDICYLSATEDACAGKRIEDFRQFFQEYEDGNRGIIVCEHCLDAYWNGEP